MLVAVCDDEKTQRDQFEAYFREYGSDAELRLFESGEQLLESYQNGERCDVIFLDIKMSGLSGIETAGKIREVDRKAALIFVTNLPDYALLGYEVRAFRYLIKPLTKEKLDAVLGSLMRELSAKDMYYIINSKEAGTVRLSVSEIVYFESFGRKLSAHLSDNEIRFSANMSAEEQKLVPFGFIRTHKSYLVNLRYIRQITHCEVVLENNSRLPLSRQRQKAVYDAFTRYLVGSSV